MPEVAVVSYRLGGTDGVSIEAAKWAWAFRELGWRIRTLAGEGVADVLLPGLAMAAPDPPAPAALADALAGADLVVAENVCSLPLNPPVTAAVAEALRGRPAILRHHDLPWERPALAASGAPPDDPCWRHVCITERAAGELRARGFSAVAVHNRFDPDPPPGDRDGTRAALGAADGELLVLQPTRAIPRKNVPGGLALAESLGGTYWLLGRAEDGYGAELERMLAGARGRVIRGGGPAPGDIGLADAYAACDVVVLPSTWEGFGNPAIESAVHRRPLAIGRYPVAAELAAFGFSWFDAGEPAPLRRYLADPDPALLERNHDIARQNFSLGSLPACLLPLVRDLGIVEGVAR